MQRNVKCLYLTLNVESVTFILTRAAMEFLFLQWIKKTCVLDNSCIALWFHNRNQTAFPLGKGFLFVSLLGGGLSSTRTGHCPNSFYLFIFF